MKSPTFVKQGFLRLFWWEEPGPFLWNYCNITSYAWVLTFLLRSRVSNAYVTQQVSYVPFWWAIMPFSHFLALVIKCACARPWQLSGYNQQPHADLLTMYGFAVSAITTVLIVSLPLLCPDHHSTMQVYKNCTVKPPNKYTTGHLSLVERLSSSRRFCLKPIGNFLKRHT